jgi:hypothetical protein
VPGFPCCGGSNAGIGWSTAGRTRFPDKLRENLFENNFPEITLLSARDSCPTGIYPKTRDNRRRLIQIKYIPAGTG